MRLGILGGTFDPIHYGHLLIAETCREVLSLDHVTFVPARISPHKTDRQPTDGHARADMIQLAIAGYSEFSVDRRELRRTGVSYTVETLRELAGDPSNSELFFLMGADSLKELMTWKEPEELAKLATLVVCNRPGIPQPTADQILAWTTPTIAARVQCVSIPGTDVSASELRDRIRSGRSIRFQTPRSVESFLRQHRLYDRK
ncbi:MAG: nicotinate-nucleotide adenylyltransferase [Planctomycetaceae bacterium]|nr:nicotinate-nucleotide adenylyltransferase [Planctomycetaceae bacterium]